MVYLRRKIIKGQSYFYLVKSIRQGDKVIQKHIRYIGKPHNLLEDGTDKKT